MACVDCDPWPDPADVIGCCELPDPTEPEPDPDADPDDPPPAPIPDPLIAPMWEAVMGLVWRLVHGRCWDICRHTMTLCRPCRCDRACDWCGCCRRVQVPWTCGTLTAISSGATELDPDDWNLVDGWLWPKSCAWPYQLSIEVTVGGWVPPGSEPDTEPAIPAPVLMAAKTMLCRWLELCTPGTCELPNGTTSVTGPDDVTLTIRTFDEFLLVDQVGLALVDRILAGWQCPHPEPRMIDPADWQNATFS